MADREAPPKPRRARGGGGGRRRVLSASALTPARAALLGLVQGPTELLPVSSSAHLTLLPWFRDWGWEELDPELRKAFDVALHGGAAAALVVGQREVIAAEIADFDRRRAAVLALSFLPALAAGVLFERVIERRLGGPRATAAGLVAGSVAMVLADRAPQERGHGDAGAVDGLALGVGQAAALAPGVSRNGATLTAARLRRFSRRHANFLSRTVALPVIVAAAAGKGLRLAGRGVPSGAGRSIAAGVAVSFASTLASQGLIRLVERDGGALWPYAAYRVGLAAAVIVRMRRQ
ncbi:MAG TPA: undecaprenyl-diphosphate phosphatase [Solirubrobacterales bacterium]